MKTAISIPVVGIPHYNRPDLLVRCIRSIDYPVETLVIIQNGPSAEMPNWELFAELIGPGWIKDLVIVRHPNAGVAGAWNEVIKLFPASCWMLANNDIEFAPGDLEKMTAAVVKDGSNMAALFGNHGHSFFVITERGVQNVGLFDENIYPAYLEDCDWMRRLHLSGEKCINVEGVAAIHGDGKFTGSCTIHSDPKARENNHRTHGGNFQYYIHKWGGINGREKFEHPYNDPLCPIWAWRFLPGIRRKQQWR